MRRRITALKLFLSLHVSLWLRHMQQCVPDSQSYSRLNTDFIGLALLWWQHSRLELICTTLQIFLFCFSVTEYHLQVCFWNWWLNCFPFAFFAQSWPKICLGSNFHFCLAFCKYLTQIGGDSFETTELCNCLRHVQLCADAWKKPFFQPSFHRWCKMSCGSKWPLSGAMKLCSPQFKIMAEYIRLHRCQSLTRSGLYINGLSLSTLGLTASSSLSISVVLPRTAESE